MILTLEDGKEYIDLSQPVMLTSNHVLNTKYPIGFQVAIFPNKISDHKRPDRCEYLLTQLDQPHFLSAFLSTLPQTHPEYFI